MTFTTALPWTEEESRIKKLTQANKRACQRLLDAINAFESDQELRALLQEQHYKIFINEAKNFVVELKRYKRMLVTQALKHPNQNEHVDALDYLGIVADGVADVTSELARTVKQPDEINQGFLKKEFESLHTSTLKLAQISSAESNKLCSCLSLLVGSIAAVIAIALANPILGLVSAANFLLALCTGNSADDQFYEMKKSKDSFARAGTNLFNHRKPVARVTPQPEEPKQDPEYMGYPHLNP